MQLTRVFRTLTTLAAAAALATAGCGPGAASTTPSAPPTAAATSAPTPTPTSAPSTTPAATPGGSMVAKDVSYQMADPVLLPGVLDVYAPAGAGPWPVVVMFHGTPSQVQKESLSSIAYPVAALGFVVFAATWGQLPPFTVAPDWYAYGSASNSQVACALAFARAHALDYGGDAERLILFGHSGGSNVGSVVAFSGTAPTAGCPGGTDPVEVDALVAWDGDYLVAPEFDEMLRGDPRIYDVMAPWSALHLRKDLPVALLLSEHLEPNVQAPMPSDAVGPYLALRDRDGRLARLAALVHAFDDGLLTVADEQHVFFEGLKENGNPVTLDVMPGSAHMSVGLAGLPVFLAAFDRTLAAIE